MATPLAEPGHYRHVQRTSARDFGVAYRIIAAIAGAVPTVIGFIALTRVAWDRGGLDAAPVEVAGMTFTPAMAIGLTVLGLLALIAGATRDRASKIVVGALLVCIAAVAFIARPDTRYVVLDNELGWLLGAVGAVLLLAALLMSTTAPARRVVSDELV
jgi:Ca2+/Na+ antiporter